MFMEVLKHRSGRVIALCRAALAAIFLFAIWIDPSQPAQAVEATYILLAAYVLFAIGVAVLTWNDWWRDARLAAPAHFVDIAIFSVLVLVTDGYTSPFFVFFLFLILSAAIRWGWRETALTSLAVILIYLVAGLLASSWSGQFELQRFIIRSGHLLVLSAILIWFGVHQGFTGLKLPDESFLPDPKHGDPPLESAVEAAVKLIGAKRALLLWRKSATDEPLAITYGGGRHDHLPARPWPNRPLADRPLLFDSRRNRALSRGPQRRMRFQESQNMFGVAEASDTGITEGLAVPIRTDAGRGMLLLGGIPGLATDHIDLGAFIGDSIANHIQRHALLNAVEQGAIARARLALARDLHDSIVQFLAGATFRIEAISRALRSGEQPERELRELKAMLLEEQQELRSSIGALRRETMPLSELAMDLEALCGRLGRQWDIECRFVSDVPDTAAPMRLHLDTHQLIREAVANAVRHADAKFVEVEVTAEGADLRLDISNDGARNARLRKGAPWSLKERVDEANGTLMLATRKTGSSVSITLPLHPEARQ